MSSFTVEGAAAKGIIRNARVSVSDAENTSRVIGTGTASSDASGQFSVQAVFDDTFMGDFIRVTVQGGNGATMVCDSARGCGPGIAFGDTFPIDESFSLSAIVARPANDASVSLTISLLTDFAAALATQDGSSAPTQEALAQAQSQVANLFGLGSSDLTAFPIVDVTASGEATDPDAVRAALIGAGALDALFENPQATFTDAFAGLRTDFLTRDGQLVANESTDDLTLVSLEDILGGAVDAGNASPGSGTVLQGIIAGLGGDLADVGVLPPDQNTTSRPSPSAALSDLDKAKAFVSDLRLVATAIDENDVPASFEEVADELRLVGDVIDDDANAALAAANRALVTLYNAYISVVDQPLVSSVATEFGKSIAVTRSNGVVELVLPSVQIGSATVSMTASVEDSTVAQVVGGSVQTGLTGSAGIELMGRAEVGGTSIEILRGLLSVGGIRVEERLEKGTNTDFELDDYALADLDIVLDVQIATTSTPAASFAGQVRLLLNAIGYRRELIATNPLNLVRRSGVRLELLPARFDVAANDEVFSVDAALVSAAGTVNVNAQEVRASVLIDAGSAVASLASSFTFVETGTYTASAAQISGSRSILGSTVDFSFEFVAPSAMAAEVAGLTARPISASVTGYFDSSEQLVAVSAVPDDATHVLSYEETGADGSRFIRFAVADTVSDVFQNAALTDETSAAFDAMDLITFVNSAIVAATPPLLNCEADRGTLSLVVFEPYRAGTMAFRDVLLEDASNCASSISSFEIDAQTNETKIEGDVTARYSIGVSQDVVGIDASDATVEITQFGRASLIDGNAAGEAGTLQLRFAGRTFETNNDEFDIFSDIGGREVSIRNQDGVVLTIQRNPISEEYEGALTVRGEQQAVISEEAGIVIVTFSDMSFVSLF